MEIPGFNFFLRHWTSVFPTEEMENECFLQGTIRFPLLEIVVLPTSSVKKYPIAKT